MDGLYKIWLGARATVFYAGYGVLTLWFTLTASLLAPLLGYRPTSAYLHTWNRCTLGWLRVCCGIRWRVDGREHLPSQPCVLLANHQSEWETYYLPLLVFPACSVLKQELLRIPIFGWGVRLAKPIAIDRANPRLALRQIQEQGLARLAEGISVVIYPEGTRRPVGESGRYTRSGANLAIAAGVPVVAVAHNAGRCWPGHGYIKYPGTVSVSISPVFDTQGADSRELTETIQHWIESHKEPL